jgi:predicted transposase YbfD/YdcC
MSRRHSEVERLFSVVSDYRVKPVSYSVSEVLLLVIAGIVAGQSNWCDIVEYGNDMLETLREYLPYHNGIPPALTIARILSNLDAREIQRLLRNMANSIWGNRNGQIALDGKYLGDGLFSVSAFVIDEHLVLDHSMAYTKGNELTAIREMLGVLNLQGCVVSIDAIGCQKDIVEAVCKKGGNAVISLKGNQSYLHTQIKNFFEDRKEKIATLKHDVFTTLEKGHGRVEERSITTLYNLRFLPEVRLWPNIKAVSEVYSQRWIKGKHESEHRYYIMTKQYSAQESMDIIRKHWQIENNLHWVLDVNLQEDGHKKLAKNGKSNVGTIKRMVLNTLKRQQEKDQSMRSLQRRIFRSPQYLKRALDDILNNILTP